MSKQKPKIIVILGPTASGKSALAVKLAKKFGGEVISADSRQVYKGMDIGTGKVPLSYAQSASPKASTAPLPRKGVVPTYRGVPHHMLSVLSPKRTFNAALFQKRAQAELNKILKKGKLPIICGGTGFYIDTLIYDYKLPAVPRDILLRRKLEKLTTEKLLEKLKKLDPERAESIDPKNRVRLIRSLEIFMKTRRPLPRLLRKSPYDVLKIGIATESEKLKKKIEKRLRQQFKKGMIAEVRRLKNPPAGGGLSSGRLNNLGLEYRLVNKFLEGEISRKELKEILKKEIWRYARRQMTWFRRDPEIHWVKSEKEAESLVALFLRSQN